ncbi:MAG: tetratricopeptide repeat protein [Calditrichaceae bacterium]
MSENFVAQFWIITTLLLAGAALVYIFYYWKRDEDAPPHKDSYLLALKYMAENDHRRAIEKFKETVRYNTENIDAYLKLGDILRKEGLFTNAVRIHKDLTLRGDINSAELPKVWYSLAMDYLDSKKMDNAETYLEKLIKNDQYHEEVLPYLVKIYESKNDYERAFNLLKTVKSGDLKKIKRRMAIYKILQAIEAGNKGEGKNSRIIFKEAIKIDPSCAAAFLYIGDSYMRENRPDDAIDTWTDYCKKHPKEAHILFSRLEKAWYEKGQFSKIEELYESILASDPENIKALLSLSSIYRKKGDYQSALNLIQDGMKQDMNDKILKAEIVHILTEKGQFKDASKQALELIDGYLETSSSKYSCPYCDYKSDELFWKCPKCSELNID